MQKHNIQIEIPEYVTEFQRGDEVVLYVVKINVNGTKWELKKRYSEFSDLRTDLLQNNGNIPTMPGKTLFKLKRPDQINKRKDGLEDFLKKIVDRQDLYGNERFLEFLKVRNKFILELKKYK